MVTVALAVKFNTLLPVILGTTLGIMLVNGPVVLLGDIMTHRVPAKVIRLVGAAVFGSVGLVVLSGIHF